MKAQLPQRGKCFQQYVSGSQISYTTRTIPRSQKGGEKSENTLEVNSFKTCVLYPPKYYSGCYENVNTYSLYYFFSVKLFCVMNKVNLKIMVAIKASLMATMTN